MQPENAPKNLKSALKTLSQKRTTAKSLKALAELRNLIERVEIFYPTLYVALLIYNAIIIIWKDYRKTMTYAGLHALFRLMRCLAVVRMEKSILLYKNSKCRNELLNGILSVCVMT